MSGCRDTSEAEGKGLIMSIERCWPNHSLEPAPIGAVPPSFHYGATSRSAVAVDNIVLAGLGFGR
jgi:hypothetical protein